MPDAHSRWLGSTCALALAHLMGYNAVDITIADPYGTWLRCGPKPIELLSLLESVDVQCIKPVLSQYMSVREFATCSLHLRASAAYDTLGWGSFLLFFCGNPSSLTIPVNLR